MDFWERMCHVCRVRRHEEHGVKGVLGKTIEQRYKCIAEHRAECLVQRGGMCEGILYKSQAYVLIYISSPACFISLTYLTLHGSAQPLHVKVNSCGRWYRRMMLRFCWYVSFNC